MCGIAGFHLKNPKFVKNHEGVEKLANKLLLGIESRGKHATGFVAVTSDGKVVMDKAAVTATEFIKDREAIPTGVQTALLHTRWATKGPKEEHQNNHPVLFNTCFAIHNGHINNDDDLFEEYKWQRPAEVDSVAIPAIIDALGFDHLPEALSKLKGNMATAFIDPIKHPKTVVLARGESSPLVVFENEHFIMWASLTTALRDAWAEVLGTPPHWNKFETVKEGTIIVVNDTETTRSEFKVARPFGFQSARSGTTQHGTGKNGSRTRNASRNISGIEAEAAAVTACRQEIAAYVKSDKAQARRWKHKDSYTDADFKDVKDPQVKRWVPCYGCQDLIIHEDMRKTINWGTICIDCHQVTINAIQRKYREDQDDDATCAGTDVPRIAAIDRDALESWSQKELMLHNATLEEVSKRVGSYYTPRLIEFLAFLTTPEYREYAGSAVVELIDKLRDIYEETYAGVAEDHWNDDQGGALLRSEEDAEDTQVIPLALPPGESAGNIPRALSTLYDYCIKHEVSFKLGEGCGDCAAANASACGVEAFERTPAAASGEIIELPQCPDCKTYILKDKGRCAVCEALDGAAEGTGTDTEVEHQHTNGKCMKCGHKTRITVKHSNGGVVNYCKKHFKMCHTEGCSVEANHILATGERRCHNHVRGIGGALSDTTLLKRGVEITEVT